MFPVTGSPGCQPGDRGPVPGRYRRRATLAGTLPGRSRHWPGWAFGALVLLLFLAGVGAGMATGHWQSALDTASYRFMIPLAVGG